MADEHQFIRNGLQRSQIDEFFAQELERAGYGGMDVAKTPMGTQIVLRAEKPGMVIGKGGKNIRKVTAELEERFELDDPQIDVQEVDEPDLNARIVADRLANALERGWYFRKAGHTTIDRIMDSGALGAEIVLSGKVTGARSRVEKFNRGYIKHNGEPADEIVDVGQSVAVMKLGTIGVTVKIIPPEAELPDDFRIREDVDPDRFAPTPAEGEAATPADAEGEGEAGAEAGGVEELLAEEVGGGEAAVADEEVVAVEPDEVVEDDEDGETADAVEAEAEVEVEADADADDEPSTAPDVDEDIEAEAARIVAQMEEEGEREDDT